MAAETAIFRAVDAEEDELLLLAHMISEPIKKRIIERPNAFRKFTSLDDETIDRLVAAVGRT